LIIGVAAVGMPLAVMSTVIGVGAAWATTGTGTYNCTKVTGSVSFSPPLKNGGTSAETTTVSATVTGCTGGSPKPTKVAGKGTIHSSTNDCANLAHPQTVSLPLTNTPAVSPKSVLKATTGESISGSSITFTLTGSVTGSYPSSSASAKGKIKQTTVQVGTACGSSAGLKSVTISSGSATKF